MAQQLRQQLDTVQVAFAPSGDLENVLEVTIPVLSRLDDMWCDYSTQFIRGMAGSAQPWFLYHCTRGAHFDNYPLERFLGASPARHPYKDTLLELDEIVGRLVRELEATGQLEHTLIVLSSDNGPHMETWPDAAYTPNADATDWDYRVSYEIWVSSEAFAEAGFGSALIENVHASPSKLAGPSI